MSFEKEAKLFIIQKQSWPLVAFSYDPTVNAFSLSEKKGGNNTGFVYVSPIPLTGTQLLSVERRLRLKTYGSYHRAQSNR